MKYIERLSYFRGTIDVIRKQRIAEHKIAILYHKESLLIEDKYAPENGDSYKKTMDEMSALFNDYLHEKAKYGKKVKYPIDAIIAVEEKYFPDTQKKQDGGEKVSSHGGLFLHRIDSAPSAFHS